MIEPEMPHYQLNMAAAYLKLHKCDFPNFVLSHTITMLTHKKLSQVDRSRNVLRHRSLAA